jgi:hypothetical protein
MGRSCGMQDGGSRADLDEAVQLSQLDTQAQQLQAQPKQRITALLLLVSRKAASAQDRKSLNSIQPSSNPANTACNPMQPALHAFGLALP